MKKYLVLFYFIFPLHVCSQVQTTNPFQAIDAMIDKMPDSMCQSTDRIAAYINQKWTSDDEKARAIFYWTASHIRYDIDNMFAINFNEKSQDKIDKGLQTKKGVCIHYAEIFNDIARKSHVSSYVITGYTKQNGKTDFIPHAWCGVKLNSKWYLCDPTWGAGYVSHDQFVKKINNAYYKVDPEKMIASHMPFDYLFQFKSNPITPDEFLKGKPNASAPKMNLDVNAAIDTFEQQGELPRLESIVERVQQHGVKNAMIFDFLANRKVEIENYKHQKLAATFNEAVSNYNEATKLFNAFIGFRNEQFKPTKPDAEIKQMIEAPKQKIRSATTLLNSLQELNRENREQVTSILQSIDELNKLIREQEEFVNTYLSKNKAGRKSMFYKLTMWGIPIN